MDQKRLLIAIAVSIAILLGFQFLLPKAPPRPAQLVAESTSSQPANPDAPRQAGTPAPNAAAGDMLPKDAPRLPISAARVSGTLSLRGAMLDDLVLRDYHEELSNASPLVRVLAPQYDAQPNYIQFGWTSATPGVKLPDDTTVWTASAKALTQAAPVTLSWDNGAGLTFSIKLAIDDNYMFTAVQSVHNASGGAVVLTPFSRVRRDYQPVTSGYYILHEGPVGVLGGTLKDPTYATTKSDGEKHDGLAATYPSDGGWAGITDKYWLTALVPDQASKQVASFRYGTAAGGAPRYEVDFANTDAQTVAPGADVSYTVRAFAGAKEVHLLDRYESEDNIPHFDKAVDFGWFYFLTKPIFFALDWLYGVLGNFGLAIMVFTVFAKALFFPLANKSYKSMSKMKLLGPKMTALRERLKDDPAKLQSEMMALYKAEKVNPASGCLPMVVQIPVFFSLYKVIFVTIEMRHAPFFGWIHDLSALDPTNLFNLFGLLPFNPIGISPLLHLSAWTLIMGFTMFMQQQLNPPPPDPMQARLFKFMPLIFMFMMGRFPAGLLIYWSWNNTLTIAQQWLIMRRTKLAPSRPPALTRSAKSRS
jgi:YidC/Oxa1 family membrane protein insertase